ncbi:acetylxylan esterase [bacterium]|nr:acetylxylan esterase [bacterium]
MKRTVNTLLSILCIFMLLISGCKTKPVQNLQILPPGQAEKDLTGYLLAKIPAFVMPSDTTTWKNDAELLRKRLLNEVILRGVPSEWISGPVNIVWGETIACGDYTIRKLRYEAIPGLWIGALLYEPVGLKRKVPAVLNVNGHVMEPGMTIDYKQARCINCAKRGMLALNIEWIGMGQLHDIGYWHSNIAYLDLCGVPGVSVFYLHLKRGLDVLLSHKMADPGRIAVTGLSGGGWQTIMISALDTRVKLSVPVAGYSGIVERLHYPRDIGDLEQVPTDMAVIADYTHLTAMLAPRPALLIYNATDDCCFLAERVKPSVYDPIVPLYQMFGLPDRFALHINEAPGTHNYLQDNREAFYRFINRHFLPQKEWNDSEIPVENEIRTQEELAIEYPPDNGTFYTLTVNLMSSLPRQVRPVGDEKALDVWRGNTRRLLRDVVRPESDYRVDSDPAPVTAFSDVIDGIAGKAYIVRINNTWTLPLVDYSTGKSDKKPITVIASDGGINDASTIVREVLARGERAIVADLLFTGECSQMSQDPGWFAQVISCVGRRALGIQVSQLGAVIDHIGKRYPGREVRVITSGRVAGLAALVLAALNDHQAENLEIRGLDLSLKDLVYKNVIYERAPDMFVFRAPSMFCFGLLELVDIPELIELAHPAKVTFSSVY